MCQVLVRRPETGVYSRTSGMSCCRSWVGTRRVALLHVSSSPPFSTGVRLSPHRLSTSGRSPWGYHEASVSISAASTGLHPCFIPFRQHARARTLVDSLRVRWVLCSPPTLCTPYFQRLGAFAVGSTPRVDGVTVLRLLCPIRLFVRALAFRWGLPCLLPTRLAHPSRSLPCSAWRTQTACCRWRVPAGPFRSLRLPSQPPG